MSTNCYANTHRNGHSLHSDEDDDDQMTETENDYMYKSKGKTKSKHCIRCGRKGHTSSSCYANTHRDGYCLSSEEEDTDEMEEEDITESLWACESCGQLFDTEQGARYHEMRWCTRQKHNRENTARMSSSSTTEQILGTLASPTSDQRGVYVVVLDNGNRYVGKSENITSRIQQHKLGYGSAWCKQNGTHSLRQEAPITPPHNDLNIWEQNETIAQMMQHGCNRVRGWEFTTCNQLSNVECEMYERLVFASANVCRNCGHTGHYANQCKQTTMAKWLQDVRMSK